MGGGGALVWLDNVYKDLRQCVAPTTTHTYSTVGRKRENKGEGVVGTPQQKEKASSLPLF